MDRASIDRWTDTTAFRAALLLAAIMTVPVLGLGLITSFVMLVIAVAERRAEFAGAVIVAMSVGGAVGIGGWLRAHSQVERRRAHDITATLVCLSVGIATALAVGGSIAVPIVVSLLYPWGPPPALLIPAALFVAAQLVWVLSGIAWMLRLSRSYAERTGRAFDGLPVVLLVVAIGLLSAAVLVLTGL